MNLGRRVGAKTVLAGVIALAALGIGCGSGGSGGSSRLRGGGSGSGGSTGATSYGPTASVVYTAVTADNSTRTPLAQTLAGAEIGGGAALALLPTSASTAGTAHQIIAGTGIAVSPDRRLLFVGDNATNQLEAFLTQADGSLAAGTGGPVAAGQATSIATHPSLPIIYVAATSAGSAASQVAIFGYDSATGALSPESPLPVAEALRDIAVDPSGRFLVTTHMFATSGGPAEGVALYFLDSTGLPVASLVQRARVAHRPASAVFDRTSTRLYVRSLDDGIYAFAVNQSTGALTPINTTAYPVGGFFSDLVASPFADVLFGLTAFTSEIRPFRIDPQTGALTALPAVALSDDCQHLAIGRRTAVLFATSRSQSRIHSFSYDAGGALTAAPGSPLPVPSSTGTTGAIAAVD
jgi:6-phosphogluconolactonase (cycloisomerase 2 family)